MATPSTDLEETTPPIHIRGLISSRDAGLIIGPAGANVQEIRSKTGCRVRVGEAVQDSRERILFVSGSETGLAEAFQLLAAKFAGADEAKLANVKFLIPHQHVGAVIGKSGTAIRQVQDTSGCRLSVSDELMPNSTERLLVIRGNPEQIGQAVAAVVAILAQFQERLIGHVSYKPQPQKNLKEEQVTMSVSSEFIGALIGRGGGHITHLRTKTHTNISIGGGGDAEALEDTVSVVITGSAEGCKNARALIEEKLAEVSTKLAADSQRRAAENDAIPAVPVETE